MSTKERIIEESMKLFSIYGFDAVSIRQIASAVGVGNSALYKHFVSKQSILDAIVSKSKEQFCQQYKNVTKEVNGLQDMIDMCLSMYHYQTQNEWMVMFRRLLLVEQFKNEEMAHLYREFFIDMPIRSEIEIFQELMNQGVMKRKNPEVLAMELYSPFYLYHMTGKDGVEILFTEHVENFFKMYLTQEEKNE